LSAAVSQSIPANFIRIAAVGTIGITMAEYTVYWDYIENVRDFLAEIHE